MEYLLLWSGSNDKGMKKARIPATEAQGITGHIGRYGLVVPDREAIVAALPYRFKKAMRRCGGFWFDHNNDRSPAHCDLSDRRGKHLIRLYLQPLDETRND